MGPVMRAPQAVCSGSERILLPPLGVEELLHKLPGSRESVINDVDLDGLGVSQVKHEAPVSRPS